MMDVADTGDFNMLMMKFNRKGEYVVTAKNTTICPDGQNHMVYNSPKHGQWVIQEFDAFWKNNQENVKELCK
jgi:hypothetical protein